MDEHIYPAGTFRMKTKEYWTSAAAVQKTGLSDNTLMALAKKDYIVAKREVFGNKAGNAVFYSGQSWRIFTAKHTIGKRITQVATRWIKPTEVERKYGIKKNELASDFKEGCKKYACLEIPPLTGEGKRVIRLWPEEDMKNISTDAPSNNVFQDSTPCDEQGSLFASLAPNEKDQQNSEPKEHNTIQCAASDLHQMLCVHLPHEKLDRFVKYRCMAKLVGGDDDMSVSEIVAKAAVEYLESHEAAMRKAAKAILGD